jgi:CRP-like cAMP-binding protein
LAGFVDSTVMEIDERLRELKDETARLQAARAALAGGRRGPGRPPGSTSASASPAGRRTARRPGRPRGRRGGNTRSNQALELVIAQPGITIPQLAEALKIQPNYLYRVMPKLVSDGQIRRDGQGWFPITSE